ncbi:YibE/F family protein [Clostridium botulinum]|uniref:Membrane protein, YbiE/YbiF family n=1 Tax=Clostridium botulinum (strain Eklund 17B / Type B) TaxID=935198 RepID=B2TR41_CLOBB|nr:membrane protein, YbiE/YbiF family [Clostridium botulinum B str. Eklund 17B (NRP)]MBY6977674.1 YibE/F family protein [Clostridium botulinum]MBY7002138.1 YibE/F family protein [Clostridium botulinum]MCR1275805.1 YibE/F family protein [Clostridium botulinum]NFD71389.1 YibE/F family protein [Clostridium botulinum]
MELKKYKTDIIFIVVTLILGLVIIYSSKFVFTGGFIDDKANRGVDYFKAQVIQVNKEKLQEDKYIEDIELGYQEVKVRILDGPYKDNEYNVLNNMSRLYNTKVKTGSKVIAALYIKDGEINDIMISSFTRSHVLITMGLLFLISILLIGGFRGLKAIVSLVFTIICVIYLMLPLMLRGVSPIFSSFIVATISITITLILISGINKKSTAAILGTLSGVVIAGIFAYIFGVWANLSGVNLTDAESIMYISETTGLKIRGIMFAGILISALGAVMDVAMSISSSIFEIHSINNSMSISNLFKSGMNIGKDIIGTMANTLILAFAGGSLNLLILLYSSNMTFNRLMNLDVIGTEVIQGLAGSIGIILTVPITAIVTSYLCKYKKQI